MYPFDVRLIETENFSEDKVCSTGALGIERGLKDIDAIEDQEVSFEVQLSKADTRGKWLKDGKILYPDQK